MCLMALSTIWALLHFWLLFTPAGTVEEDWSWYPGNSAARRSSKALNRSLRSRSHLLNWAAEATLKKISIHTGSSFFSQVFNLNWKAVKYYVANRTYSRRPCEEPVPRRTTLDDAMASTLEYIQIQFHQFLGKHWRFLKFFTIFMFLQFFFHFSLFLFQSANSTFVQNRRNLSTPRFRDWLGWMSSEQQDSLSNTQRQLKAAALQKTKHSTQISFLDRCSGSVRRRQQEGSDLDCSTTSFPRWPLNWYTVSSTLPSTHIHNLIKTRAQKTAFKIPIYSAWLHCLDCSQFSTQKIKTDAQSFKAARILRTYINSRELKITNDSQTQQVYSEKVETGQNLVCSAAGVVSWWEW